MHLKDINKIIKRTLCDLGTVNLFNIEEEYWYINWHKRGNNPPTVKNYNLIYIFIYKGEILKVGKDNTGTGSRLRQHYGFSAPSTLAKSLCNDDSFPDVNKDNVRDWIKNNAQLVTIGILKSIKDVRAITGLIESVFIFKFKPKYERTI